jgi:hypothetical protein
MNPIEPQLSELNELCSKADFISGALSDNRKLRRLSAMIPIAN